MQEFLWTPMDTDVAQTCKSRRVNSLLLCRLKLTGVNKLFYMVPSGNAGSAVLPEPRSCSWAKFLSRALIKADQLRLTYTHLQQKLVLHISPVLASQLQLTLLFIQSKKKVPLAQCMCSPPLAYLSSSDRFLSDTCIHACPSHFLSVLVSVKAFWRDQCVCVYLGCFLMFFSSCICQHHTPKHTHRVDSRSLLSVYSISCPSPMCIAS